MHTFQAFSFLDDVKFVLVLPENEISNWKNLCQKHQFSIPHQIVEGGPKRFHSVKSGLKNIPDDVLVAIHDGVRPLVSQDTITNAFELAERKGNAVPSIPILSSIREVYGSINKHINRDNFRLIQTPQVFQSSQIKKAYQQVYRTEFKDDATVLESTGQQIYLCEGNPENIKITNPLDLTIAGNLLQ